MMRLAGFVVLGALLSGCSDPTEAQQCADLDAYLEGRDRMLDRDCTEEGSCEVFWVAPDHPVAVASAPTDRATLDAVAAFDESCGSFGTVRGTPQALCVQQYRDEFLPDGGSYEVEAERTCELVGIYEIVGGDAGFEPDVSEPDATGETCSCTADAACGAGSRCIACSCVADSPCARVCDVAETCGRLASLNLGTTGAACTASCDGALERDPVRWNTFISCVDRGGCAGLNACLSAATR